jgi:hypothetical protein
MRELIAGRSEVVNSWAAEDDKKAKETLDAKKKSDDSVDTNDLSIDVRSSDASLDRFVERLGTEDGNNSDEPPPDKTRIEQNPLELLKELDAAKSASRESAPSLPRPPTVEPPKLPKTDKPAIAGGRFPDAAQLPTMVAPTPPPATPPAPAPPRARHGTRPDPAMAPTAAAAPIDLTSTPTAPLAGSRGVPPVGPHSATHAAVRPSQLQAIAESDVVVQASRPDAAPAIAASSPYPVLSGGRPYSTDLAPSTPPMPGGHRPSVPRIPNTGPNQPPLPSTPSPSLMSPVGESYPSGVDWHAAAAKRAHAFAPWQLALLFVGALGIALMLTMIVAKIVR